MNPPPTANPSPSPRLMSVDALRGFEMFWIVGADFFMTALGQMSANPVLRLLGGQLEHKAWAGFAFYDLIFPLFVFLVGVSIVLSLTKALAQEGRGAVHGRILRRAALLYAVALFYSGGVTNPWPDIRLLGVLNRIALCYLFAALIFCHFRWRGVAAICAGLLVGYWAVMALVPFPDVRPVDASGRVVSEQLTATHVAQLNFASTNRLQGVYEPGLNLANYIDQRFLPGKKWDKTWDPEGLLSTLPAIATCLLGVLAGLLLQNHHLSGRQKVAWLLGAGGAAVVAGWLWHLEFPVIKKIWTSSYVLVAGGYSAILLGVFYQVVEIWDRRTWAQPFVWIGANSITIYLANNLMDFERVARRLAGGDVKRWLDGQVAPGAGDLLIAVVAVSLAVLLARFLYRRKIFLRL